MEVESSVATRLPFFKKERKTSVRTEYPNQKKTFADKLNNLLAGETNTFYSIEDSDNEDDDSALTQEKVEEIVQARLENYHKKMMQELKDFHADMIEKLDSIVGSPS